jgi:hypothetical protein
MPSPNGRARSAGSRSKRRYSSDFPPRVTAAPATVRRSGRPRQNQPHHHARMGGTTVRRPSADPGPVGAHAVAGRLSVDLLVVQAPEHAPAAAVAAVLAHHLGHVSPPTGRHRQISPRPSRMVPGPRMRTRSLRRPA